MKQTIEIFSQISSFETSPRTVMNLSLFIRSSSPSKDDGYCCKLCGLKGTSKEQIKDHINMHFIGHIKRKSSEARESSQDGDGGPPPAKKRPLLSPQPHHSPNELAGLEESKENVATSSSSTSGTSRYAQLSH